MMRHMLQVRSLVRKSLYIFKPSFGRRERNKMKRIILYNYSLPLFESFNGGNVNVIPLFWSFRLCLGVHKGMKWNEIKLNDHKRMEMNEME